MTRPGSRPELRPELRLELRPVRLDTGSSDEDGQLVFLNDRLVAVLVKLSDQHGAEAGQWFLEHSFGPVGRSRRPTFPDLETAMHWITEHYAAP